MAKNGNKNTLLSIPSLLVVLLILLTLKIVVGDNNTPSPSPIARPNCVDKCGNISIPYPFGIGEGCHYSPHLDTYGSTYIYNLTCNNTVNPPILNYGVDIQVVNITLDGEFRILENISYVCYNSKSTEPYAKLNAGMNMKRFTLNATKNYIGAIGCNTYVWLNGSTKDMSEFYSGCMSFCAQKPENILKNNACSGVGCCLVSIPSGVTDIYLNISSLNYQRKIIEFNPCSMAFTVAKDYNYAANEGHTFPFSISEYIASDASFYKGMSFPVVYDWSIGTNSCKNALDSGEEFLCKDNSICIDWLQGYRCQCKPGFRSSNPYLYPCIDIDECAEGDQNNEQVCPEHAQCINTNGSYSCQCRQGYSRPNYTRNSDVCIMVVNGGSSNTNKDLPLKFKIIAGVGAGIIVSLVAAIWFHWHHGNQKILKMKEMYFRQNGGNILQQKLSQRDVAVGSMVEMFTFEELKKATNNYCEGSIIGQGGFGMVYKGTLAKNEKKLNNQVIAIKRSLKVNSNQVEQFINEIVALSQINNKNVVKLIGCCLETEVPLLVYEYVSNGTLYDHLHDQRKANFLAWDIRLRIATEVSEVLAYLHTTISIPIIHRDIKSANILLDKDYTAKVADFGASKLAPSDREQFATMVQGTCGYLDPEYMQTGELTEKSDVYSFGVVLVELITGEKVISYAKPENERSLAVYFLRKLKEDCLFEIVDSNIKSGDGTLEQMKEVAFLAKRCLKLKGDDRPNMKEIARELDRISEIGVHPWSNNGLLLQEESEYLLGETHIVINQSYGDHEVVDEPLTSQSSVMQLLPLNDAR